MATVGYNFVQKESFGFYDALRSYDVETATSFLHDKVILETPHGNYRGIDDVKAHLEEVLAPSLDRPSFTTRNISGQGNLCHVHLSVSGRFGYAPKHMVLSLLTVQDKIQHIRLAPEH